MPGESYRRRLGSLVCLRDVFRTRINSSFVDSLQLSIYIGHADESLKPVFSAAKIGLTVILTILCFILSPKQTNKQQQQ